MLAGVTARLRGSTQVFVSDEWGRLTVAADSGRLQLSHVGYAALGVYLTPLTSGPVVVRLVPRPTELAGVSVRAGADVVRLVPAGTLRKSAPTSTPNWFASAIWHRPPTSTGSYRLSAVEIQLAKRPLCSPDDVVQDQQAFREGRVRVRLLVPAPDGTFAPADSLTSALLITPAMSRLNHKGVVRLDLTDRALVLPETGLVVLLDVLPTFPNEQLTDNQPAPEGNRVDVRQQLPAGSSRIRRTSVCDYPALAQMQNVEPGHGISAMMLPRHLSVTTRLSAVPQRQSNNLAVTVELQPL